MLQGSSMARLLPPSTDTIIVGNGPSALILSYILHGHIPVYCPSTPHPDPFLHSKLKDSRDLLDLDIDTLTEHFSASRFSYSTQALPINVLLDTLVRPLGEVDDTENKTCVKWIYQPDRAIPHIVLGDTISAGGVWANNPVEASWDIGTLSYAGMLSLPGYSFDDHFRRIYKKPLASYLRPSRRQVADYFAAYPFQVGIDDVVHCGLRISGVRRNSTGFYVKSHDVSCRHLVLASGIFSQLIPPRPLLEPLLSLPIALDPPSAAPILIIGSGFSAADVIISTPRSQKIIHIFKWAPTTSPSPLRACHQQAYPEYAGVYRKMKLSALTCGSFKERRPRVRRGSSLFDLGRNWDDIYEGLPNTVITGVQLESGTAVIQLQNSDGDSFERRISSMSYVVGRRGSLDYLNPRLRQEVCGTTASTESSISGQTLRGKANYDLEVAPNVFITGSLTGDSLIRFAYGGCTYAAGSIMADAAASALASGCHGSQAAGAAAAAAAYAKRSNPGSAPSSPRRPRFSADLEDLAYRSERTSLSSCNASPRIPAMNGFDGHNHSPLSP